MQPCGRIRPHLPIADLKNTTINELTRGRGLERPGDGVAALVLEGYFGRSAEWEVFLTCVIFLYRRVLTLLPTLSLFHNPFRYSFGFCHACTVGLHTE